MAVFRQEPLEHGQEQDSRQQPERNQKGRGAGDLWHPVIRKQQQRECAKPDQHHHADRPVHQYRHGRVHRRHCPSFRLGFLIFDQIVNPGDIAADRARRKQIEEHADQIILNQILEGRSYSEGSRQHRPAYRSNSLRDQVDAERQGDIRNLCRGKCLHELFEVNARDEIGDQPRADEKLEKKNYDGLGSAHASSGGWTSASVSSFARCSTITLRPTTLRRPSA